MSDTTLKVDNFQKILAKGDKEMISEKWHN